MCQHNPEKIEKILSLVQVRGHERILDVGTGTGVLIPFYEKLLSSGTVMALDSSEKMIEVAKNKFPREKHPRIEFRVGDVHDMGYSEEFDMAMCYSCFPHFHDKQQAIGQLARALKS
ncbi:MAG: class I SAM-dependent methyltransferase, partial [Candidatus Thermoplasmatota archaeon]|nr:class I SAM-dependent methyltransferase [Candidatus Thermoplasmatota archaeon]